MRGRSRLVRHYRRHMRVPVSLYCRHGSVVLFLLFAAALAGVASRDDRGRHDTVSMSAWLADTRSDTLHAAGDRSDGLDLIDVRLARNHTDQQSPR